MPTAKRASVDVIPADVLPRLVEADAAMRDWADRVVTAWFERRDGSFKWHEDDFSIWLHADVVGRSILNGECLVTRAKDGFIGLISGKHYRSQSMRFEMQLLQNALVSRGVPGFVVPQAFPVNFVDAELLDQWYDGAKVWQALSVRGRLEKYCAIADDLVGWFLLGGREKEYYDGFLLARAGEGYIDAGLECIAASEGKGAQIAFVSGRRYRLTSHAGMLRFGVRLAFDRHGFRYREVRPSCSSYCTESHLLHAGKMATLRLT